MRRLTENEALAMLRPASVPIQRPSVPAATPEPAISWFTRLTSFFSSLNRRA
jgi:lysozyme